MNPTEPSPMYAGQQSVVAAAFDRIVPLQALLAQLAWAVRRLDDGQYQARPAAGISGSVGGHVRHCLDHVDALLAGTASGTLTYDHRRRGTTVETCRRAALREIRRIMSDLHEFGRIDLDHPVQVLAALDSGSVSLSAASSAGRELAFVVSHTIHHLAMIALLLRDFSIEVPARFGYAPTTPPASAPAA